MNGTWGSQHLQRELGYDAAQFLTKFCAEVRNEHDILERSSEFTIGIEYRLVLTKKNDDADIALTSDLLKANRPKLYKLPRILVYRIHSGKKRSSKR